VCLLNFLSYFFLPYFLVASSHAFFHTSLLVYFPSYLSTSRIGSFHFHAGGRRRQPNLAVFFGSVYIVVYFVMDACLLLLCFSFSVLSQEIGWEERLRKTCLCVGCDVKS